MEQDLKRQRQFNFWFMIVSVLLHALFFWFLFFLKHYNNNAFPLFDEQKRQEMLAGAAQESAPQASVVFEDEPAPETLAQKPMEWTSGGLKQADAKVEPLQEDQQPIIAQNEAIKTEQTVEEKEIAPEKIEKESTEIASMQPQEQELIKTEAPPAVALTEDRVNDRFAERIIEKKEPAPTQKKTNTEKLTLATLARGFLNQIQEKGDHLVNMVGDKKGNPSAEQLKYERYFQKIDSSLKNAMRIHRYKFEDIAHALNPVKATCIVYVHLQRNGRAKTIDISTSTNIRVMDDFLLFLVREAASGFPPVPKYIGEDPLIFSIHFPVEIVKDNRSFAFHRS